MTTIRQRKVIAVTIDFGKAEDTGGGWVMLTSASTGEPLSGERTFTNKQAARRWATQLGKQLSLDVWECNEFGPINKTFDHTEDD